MGTRAQRHHRQWDDRWSCKGSHQIASNGPQFPQIHPHTPQVSEIGLHKTGSHKFLEWFMAIRGTVDEMTQNSSARLLRNPISHGARSSITTSLHQEDKPLNLLAFEPDTAHWTVIYTDSAMPNPPSANATTASRPSSTTFCIAPNMTNNAPRWPGK